MSIDDRNKEPQTDLSLPLNYHNRSIRLRKNIGAGVNATSKVDSTLVTSHPLEELVLSPRKGISVKTTDRTLTDKQSAILWGMGSSTLAVSSTKSASPKSGSDYGMDEKNDIISTSHVNFDVDKVDAPGRATRSDMMGGLNQGHNEDTEDKTCEVHTQTAYRGREKVNFGTSLDVGPVTGENQLPGNALSVIPGNASGIAISSQEGPSRKHNVSTAFVGQEDRSMLKIAGAFTENIDRLEFGAENYLLAEGLVNFNDHNSSCRELEGVHPLDVNVHGKCLMNPRMEEYLRKGKAKALSCGDVNDQLVDDNDSHGSAGSCNKMSATSGNTKRGLDQQLIVTSKRLKQGSISDADSASFIRQSSSFMSWITNMIKGYPGYKPDNSPSSMLAGMLTTHAEHESHSQKPIASGQELRGVGFRKLFKSICCSNDSVEGRKVYVDYQNKEGSGDAKNSSVVDVNAVPLAAYGTGDNAHEHICRLNKMCDHPKSGKDIVSPSKQGTILSLIPRMETVSHKVANESLIPRMETVSHKVANETQIVKNRSYNSSVDKERAHTSEYNDSDNTLGEKAAQGIGQKQDYLGSVWITRFRHRIAEPASSKHLTSMSIGNRVLPNSEDKGSSVKCLMNVVHEEQSTTLFSEGRNGFSKNEDLVGSESDQMKGKDEQNLEVMASVFARRLDALKQVVPFGNTCKPAPTTDTCFFCGATGHDIQYCSEITGSELEYLSHKVKSVDQATDAPPPCVCINCFQLSHWAIECPQRSSRKSTLGSEKAGRSLTKRNYISAGTLGPHRMSRGGNLEPGTGFIQLQGCSSKLDHDIIEAKNPLDLGYGGQEAGESSSPLLSTAMPGKLSVGMEGVFDAIRRLRLSRSDFLRSMDSQIPPSYLIGFYLRVRLSNCKEGVGEKGYYVACIQGSPDGAGSKTSVTVTIGGGFTGLVESRYISNQDFLEDELVTWWTTTARPGHSNNPSLEELEQKYEERTKLGF